MEKFTVKFAETEEENNKAYALRYSDMLKEYRPELNILNGLDKSEYDEYAKQIICIDNDINEVVGCYRIITSDILPKGNTFICEEEFNIDELKNSGMRIAELSRAVVKNEYRNSPVLMILFKYILNYLIEQKYRYIIGEASFHGVDKNEFVTELSYLAHYHGLEEYKITSKEDKQITLIDKDKIDVMKTKRSLPPLIRAYLSFGAKVSKVSFTDWDFGSVDVFILMDSKWFNEAFVKRFIK